MRRISSHIPLIAALATICLAGQAVTMDAVAAAAAQSTPVNKAALNKAVQEALAKAQTEKSTGAQGTTGTGPSSGSLGSSESFSNLTGKGGEEETPTQTTATTSSSSSSSGVSKSVLVPIFVVGALLLAGIAFFIVRDARNVAPAGDGLGSAGSSRDQAARLRKRRAKAKAARRQRRRNR
jgi:cobalamin biosynthesis Mg chelatase CobN